MVSDNFGADAMADCVGNFLHFYVADPFGNILDLMQLLLGEQFAVTNPASLVKEAAQGHVDNVRRILSQHPAQVCDCVADCSGLLSRSKCDRYRLCVMCVCMSVCVCEQNNPITFLNGFW